MNVYFEIRYYIIIIFLEIYLCIIVIYEVRLEREVKLLEERFIILLVYF